MNHEATKSTKKKPKRTPRRFKTSFVELTARRQVICTRVEDLTYSKLTIYSRDSLGAICPVHNVTHATGTMADGGIELACGCIWKSGGGSLEGWFREEDKS